MRVCALLVVALPACTDPAIEMHLVVPSAAETADIDVSCITAVDIRALGENRGDAQHPPDDTADCLDLAHAPASFADIASMMHGQFSAPLPASGLAGVALRGFAGHCGDQVVLDHEAMFYGGAPYTSGDLAIPMKPNISCNATTTYTVRAVDLTNAGACAPLTAGFDYAADIRPALLGPVAPAMVVDYGTSVASPGADGSTQISSFNKIAGAGCIAAAYEDDSASNFGVTCIDTTAPTLCAAPGQIEVGMVPGLFGSYIDSTLVQQFGDPIFGAAYDPGAMPKAPLAGASVTIDDGMQGQVVYVEPGAGALESHAAPTGSSGMFLVYAKGAIGITVAAPGHKSWHYIVTGTPELPSTLIAALPRM